MLGSRGSQEVQILAVPQMASGSLRQGIICHKLYYSLHSYIYIYIFREIHISMYIYLASNIYIYIYIYIYNKYKRTPISVYIEPDYANVKYTPQQPPCKRPCSPGRASLAEGATSDATCRGLGSSLLQTWKPERPHKHKDPTVVYSIRITRWYMILMWYILLPRPPNVPL